MGDICSSVFTFLRSGLPCFLSIVLRFMVFAVSGMLVRVLVLATLMHQILQKRCPSYLADLVTFNTTYRDVISDLSLTDPPPYTTRTNSFREACIFWLRSWCVE